ncbi:MAG: CBS domain-containing protein [Myxococcales bacterium]|nr:CBS domain-containing protein [Myxococcales bacterium]
MKRSEKITHLMTSEPLTVHEGQKLSEVHKLFGEHKIHHIPVVSGKRFIGLISSNDLLRVSYGDTYAQDPRTVDALLDTMTIREVMAEDVLTVPPTTTIRDAAEQLASGMFHCLPVVDEGGELVGVVTSTDMIKFLLAQY